MEQHEREACIAANRREFGESYDLMVWVTADEAREAESTRAALLAALRGRVAWGCGATKADCRSLSPGCRACADGVWSCLFVNGVCNARCSYCPSEQREVGEPVTNALTFRRPEDYADYLRQFGFRGASISGGEPLLTMDRTLAFLERTKTSLPPDGHLWMYTNGILLTPERAELLAETGLDELRIDLTAKDYDLEAVRVAAGRIPIVSVEIPALPQDEARLIGLLPALADAGVKHLNLHELRATPHNVSRLARQGQRFRHGPRVTALGSELTALRALEATLDRGISLPVNYCSAVYKALYQARAARARAATAFRDAFRGPTAAGYLRELIPSAEGGGVRYHAASLRQGPSYQAAFREVSLESGLCLVAERSPASPVIEIGRAAADALAALEPLAAPPESLDLPVGATAFERLPAGLVPYF